MKSRRQEALHVLVVDDSAVVRRFMSAVLAQERSTTVDTASDPLIAMRKMRRQRPDVILLDVEMPRMDGLTFLRKIMAKDPIPVVICSGLAGRGTSIALEALSQGAVEIVTKPSHGVQEFLQESAIMLLDTVHAAAQAKVSRRTSRSLGIRLSADAALRTVADRHFHRDARTVDLIAVGASTGGPEALRVFLGAMPSDAPGILVVQHMPKRFTTAFARHLDQVSRLEVKEAVEGDRVLSGRALIAPGDRHMMVVRHQDHHVVRLVDGPLVSRHRPSVDVLFRSVAQAACSRAIGVIMTGMGDDGVQGLLELRQAGALTLAQDEASCVVFGMPKEAVARQAAVRVTPLARLAPLVLSHRSSASPGAEGRRNPDGRVAGAL